MILTIWAKVSHRGGPKRSVYGPWGRYHLSRLCRTCWGGGYDWGIVVTIVARVMQNLGQIANISPENQRNLIESFAMDNHRSSVLRYKFYLGIINVVEVAERIRVDEPKNQGFEKKCHKRSQMPIQIPLGISWLVCWSGRVLMSEFQFASTSVTLSRIWSEMHFCISTYTSW